SSPPASSRRPSSVRAAAAPSSSTTCRSATSRSSRTSPTNRDRLEDVMRRLFVRSFAIAFVAFALLFGLEFFLEWRRAGAPGAGDMSWAGINNAKLVDIMSPMARAYNNVLAMLLATIGLAIPLTANMHTPKLIDIFLRDTINRVVLTFMALGAAHVLWVDYMIGPKFAPTWAVGIAVYLAIAGWIILIPYFFYV